jgi:hypothetical protein
MDMVYKIRKGNSTVTGTHDKMPRHDIFMGLEYSEWVPVYTSNFNTLHCLFAGPGQDPDFNLGCRQYINIAM